jgi:hypothetical protein
MSTVNSTHDREGNDARRNQPLAAGMRALEHDTGRPVELADNDAPAR